MQRFLAVLLLAVLAIVVPEVLFGSTPLTEPLRLLATAPIYVGGAIAIRELVRRRHLGWVSIAMLGVAYGIVEEGLALGSLFNPALFNAGDVGGRALGVNWTWTQWTLGYHAVWSISIPILLVELLFPARRKEPWLGKIGLGVAIVVYLLGVAIVATIFRQFVAPDFTAPVALYVAAEVIVGALIAVALSGYGCRPAAPPPAEALRAQGHAPSPWIVGLLALLAAGAWFSLLSLPAPLKAGVVVVVPMAVALAILAVVVTLVRRWSAPGRGWTDLHRLALAVGPLLVSMAFGSFFVTAGAPEGHAGQAAASGLAIVLLILFARYLWGRQRTADHADRLAAAPVRDEEPIGGRSSRY